MKKVISKPPNKCSIIVLTCVFAASAFYGYRLIHQYINVGRWRQTSAKLLAVKITRAKLCSGRRRCLKCSVLYEYSIGNRTYRGNRATIYGRYGPEKLCTRDLRDKKVTLCYYDPKNPATSALDVKIPMATTTMIIMVSWALLYILLCTLPTAFKIVPVIYGVASAGVLLTIGAKQLPMVGAAMIGGTALLILAVLLPCIQVVS